MRLRRLTGLEREKIENELAELRESIAYYKQLLNDTNMVHGVINCLLYTSPSPRDS